MPHVVDTKQLIAENILTEAQGAEIARRSRETMVSLVVNVVLCVGIVAATLGLVFWLADALAVAVAGAVFVAAGVAVLARGGELYRMLGNAAALVGAGMLVAGGGIELVDKFQDIAGWLMLGLGAGLAAGAYGVFARTASLKFAAGAVLLMGVALHLWGLGLAAEGVSGLPRALLLGYAAALVAGAGVLVDVRFITALAIVPFAQMLDTGTGYFHAAYFFYSPEATLTVLQMSALVGAGAWAMTRTPDRFGRHAGILAIMAMVVGNLAFLVGSLWGDYVGAELVGGRPVWVNGMEWTDYHAAIDAWEARFLHISEHVFSVVWAVLLAGGAFWAAHANRRGLFNAAITFGAIHAYTQLFETMSDEPLAWALGGLAAIPLAWGMWRLNVWLALRGDGNRPQIAAA
ncbi:hypothetical protein [Silicimonas sp. MF1-12-2]|uniref:hypothetical protein n=1 Tax=Silicimonas sp. MF1-12-2 TaxID=3384793 RepID=UPI0039B5EB83